MATTSVVYDLIDALVDQLGPALAVNVLDGSGDTDDPGDYLMVGIEDPDVQGFADSVDSQQSWAGLGARARDEEGTVSCCALSWNGDGDLAAARAAVRTITSGVEDHLRADPNLGAAVPGLLWVGFGTRQVVRQVQGDTGAAVLVFFQIDFRARI